MTRLELIRLVGDVITQVDVCRADGRRGTPEREHLDELRDDLDAFQRRLVRALVDDGTPRFQDLAASLREINSELGRTIDDGTRMAATLETLVRFLEVVREVGELIP